MLCVNHALAFGKCLVKISISTLVTLMGVPCSSHSCQPHTTKSSGLEHNSSKVFSTHRYPASNSLAAGRVTHTRQVWRMLLDNKRYPGPTGSCWAWDWHPHLLKNLLFCGLGNTRRWWWSRRRRKGRKKQKEEEEEEAEEEEKRRRMGRKSRRRKRRQRDTDAYKP